MGWNTTVLILNDNLLEIESDPQFGAKLVQAIRSQCGDSRPVRMVGSGTTIIEQHHADDVTAVAVGWNCGSVIAKVLGYPRDEDVSVSVLRKLADSLGYRITKKRATIPSYSIATGV